MSNTAGCQLLQQDLQTELNTSLILFEYGINGRLGPYTLQKLQNNGFDLLRSGRETLLHLVSAVHQAFGMAQNEAQNSRHSAHDDEQGENYGFQFQRHTASYCNIDRPKFVEDGYIYLYLPERDILRYFLQQKNCYKVMLEVLTDSSVRYMEKVYYRMEQHWQEFQSHFMVLENHAESHTAGQAPDNSSGLSYNVSLDEEQRLENAEHHESTAAQIAQRHRRIKQLQTMARVFWQTNFVAALEQLRLDLPYLDLPIDIREDIMGDSKQNQVGLAEISHEGAEPLGKSQQRVTFAPYYIDLLQELESRCRLAQKRQNLQQRLRKMLEQSFGGFPLQAGADSQTGTGNETLYYEYTEERNLPDELAKLSVRYATEIWLRQWQAQSEEQFIRLSSKIQDFFVKVEKATRFRWLHRYASLRALSAIIPFKKRMPRTGDDFATNKMPAKNQAIEELLQKENLSPLGPLVNNWVYEIQLLAELLQRADIALQNQLQFFSSNYLLINQLEQLRFDLLQLCRQPCYGQDVGIQITIFYRTVRKRRETLTRLEKILRDFCEKCQFVEII